VTQPSAREAVYSKLMWPEWNPQSEARGTSYEHAQKLLDAYRAAVLREAADAIADPERRNGLGWEAARDLLRRMAEEGE